MGTGTYKKRGEMEEAIRVFRVDKENICDIGVHELGLHNINHFKSNILLDRMFFFFLCWSSSLIFLD